MNSNIDTGGSIFMLGDIAEEGHPVQSTHRVLFDNSSTSLQSGVILVRENQLFMFTGYEIPDGAEFTLNTVSLGATQIPNGRGCCETISNLVSSGTAIILFREPMTLGGNSWTINSTKKQLLVSLPGTYQLVLNDEQYFGAVHVELVNCGLVKTILPDAYLAGIGA